MRRTAVLILTLLDLDATAWAADRFVSTRGNDTANDCLASAAPCRTLARALEQAASGDVVKLANGNHATNVVLDDPLAITVSGGWSADFTTQDAPDARPRTRLTGRNRDRVFGIHADAGTISVTLERLLVKSGRGITDLGGAGRHGAGILAVATGSGTVDVTLRNATLQQNKADPGWSGGAVGVAGPAGGTVSVIAEDTTFVGNSAERGGAIDVTGDGAFTVSLERCVVKQNWARSRGGAIALEREDVPGEASLSIAGSLLEKNGTPGDGGSVLLRGGVSGTIVNTIVRRTRSGLGAITLDHLDGVAPTVDVLATTVTRYGSSGGGGGLVLWPGGVANVTSSIFWALDADLVVNPGATLNLASSNVSRTVDLGAPGDVNDLGGNLSVDPMFVKPTETDQHLRAGSPMIDAATCVGAPAIDFDGDPRPTGPGCDMGADEFAP